MNAPDRAPGTQAFAVEGWRVDFHARVGSTNDEARRQALAGDPGHVWIVADEQTAGRGRQGRRWMSPPGNFYGSALILEPCEAALAPQIGFVAGLALRRAVGDLGGADVALKWPNDLISNGAKLAGLLVEGVMTPQRRLAVIVGFGVNLASSPQGVSYPTTDLLRLLGRAVPATALLERLSRRFDETLALWDRGSGFTAIREAWLALAAGLGGPIRLSGPRGEREGIFSGIDPHGRLILRTRDTIEAVESADLTLLSSTPPPQHPLKAAPHEW